MVEIFYNAATKEEKIIEREQTQEELNQDLKSNLFKELSSLVAWFDEYDNQVKQYERCQRLSIEFDKDINELDLQAKINAQRITEIRNLLK